MALKKSMVVSGTSFISGSGFVLEKGEVTDTTPPLYIKVETVSGDKSNIKALATFSDESTNARVMHKEYVFAPNLNGGNFIAQAYEHLKTLPEFAGATDC
jgi:hypothetical protein